MALRSAPLLLLVLVTVALRESCFGASSHSMKYFYTSISDPSQGLPHFIAVGYLDDQVFVHYDSNSQKLQPRVSWMEKVGKEDPKYWDRETQISRGHEERFRDDLEILRSRYNQSKGLHTLQNMFGCELWRDRSKGGFYQLGYEGKTFISFDKETLTWVAPNDQAQITQRKWERDSGYNQGYKVYLEEICIEWLEKFLSYGNETLLRTETPKVTVRRTEVEDGMETHICQVHGFYPREIDASWTRDREVWLQDTLRGFLAPNADGTYHYWISVKIDPKERDRYRCHVEHDSLQEPLDLELKESTNSESNPWNIFGYVVAVLVVTVVIVGIWAFIYFRKRRQDGYRGAPTNNRGSSTSLQAFFLANDRESNSSDQERHQDGQDGYRAAPTNNRVSSSSLQASFLANDTESNISDQERHQDGQDGYRAAPTSDKGSSSSDQASCLANDTESNISDQGSNQTL